MQSSTLVLDASVVVDLLMRRGEAQFERRLYSERPILAAPHLLDVEVGSALRSLALRRELSAARGAILLDTLRSLPIRRFPHDVLMRRVWELRDNVTASDAVYVALAETLDATLITRDARLAGAPGLRAKTEVV